MSETTNSYITKKNLHKKSHHTQYSQTIHKKILFENVVFFVATKTHIKIFKYLMEFLVVGKVLQHN